MSYILDALKRADAERQRGAAPGLHAQHNLPVSTLQPSVVNLRNVLILGGGLLACFLAAGLWLWQTRTTETMMPGAAVSPAALLPAPAPVPMPVAIPASLPKPVPASTPKAAPVSTPVPTFLPKAAPKPVPAPALKPVPRQPAVATPFAEPQAAGPANQPKPVQAPQTPPPIGVKVKPATPSNQATGSVQMPSELPEDVRRQIPAIVITGSAYSNIPSQGVLIINNQAYTQGSTLSPGLVLKEIQPNSAVFDFNGTQFRLSY